MAVLLRLFCPIDGLQIAARNVTGQHQSRMQNDGIREHDEFSVSQAFTCANGHTFHWGGDIDVRIAPETGL